MSQEVTYKGEKYARTTIEKWKPEFENVLQGIDSQYFTSVALSVIQSNPKLLECTELSWYNSLRQAAALSLTLDGALGQAYLVPYAKKATLIIGYKGLRELVYRTGLYVDVQARCVYANDKFKIEYGLDQKLEHIPTSGDPGRVLGSYVMVVRADGNRLFHFMWLKQILRIRDNYSQAYKNAEKPFFNKKTGKEEPPKHDSMWHTDPEKAYEKTVLRSICGNRLQLSVVAQRVMNRQEKMDAGLDIGEDGGIIDISPDPTNESQTNPEPEKENGNGKGVEGMVNAIKTGNTAKRPEGNIQEKEPEETSNSVDLRIVIREELERMFPKISFGTNNFDQKIDEICSTALGKRDTPYSWKMLSTEELVELWNALRRGF